VLLDLPDTRRLASRALLCQGAVGALAAAAAAVWDRYVGLSVLGGASIVWLTTLYISRRAQVLETTVTAALWRVLVGELIKVSCTIALFLIAARLPHLVWPALLFGYVAGLIASWVVAAAPAGAVPSVALTGARNQRLEA
jgi:F0F1-type ATP synthase assembly protein I